MYSVSGNGELPVAKAAFDGVAEAAGAEVMVEGGRVVNEEAAKQTGRRKRMLSILSWFEEKCKVKFCD